MSKGYTMSQYYTIPEKLKSLYQMIIRTMRSDNIKYDIFQQGDSSEYNFFTTGKDARKVLTVFASVLNNHSYVTVYSDKESKTRFTEMANRDFVRQVVDKCITIIHKKKAIAERDRMDKIMSFLNSFAPANAKSLEKFDIDESVYNIPKKYHPIYQQIANIISSNQFDMKFTDMSTGQLTEYRLKPKDKQQEIFSVCYSISRTDDNTYLAFCIQKEYILIRENECRDLILLVYNMCQKHANKTQQQEKQNAQIKSAADSLAAVIQEKKEKSR